MPYIETKNRNLLANPTAIPNTPGELNYLITKLLIAYISDGNPLNYTKINTVMGVLSCVGQEFYRRVAVDLENQKIKENGDVY